MATGNTPESSAVADLYNSMTLEQKVGQLILANYDAATAGEIAQNCHPAGFLLGSEDFAGKDAAAMAQELAPYQTLEGVGLWLGTSEEGGTVVPVSGNSTYRSFPFYSPQQIYASQGMAGFDSDTKERCELLASLGLNLNLAPVINVSTDPSQEIYSRTLGQDSELTSQYVNDVVQASLASNVEPVLKYFPAYGTTQENGIRVDDRSKEELNATDVVTYHAGVDAGAQAVLLGHCIVNCLDDTTPASLSASVISQIRTNIGFSGVLIADDVNQAGLEAYCSGQPVPGGAGSGFRGRSGNCQRPCCRVPGALRCGAEWHPFPATADAGGGPHPDLEAVGGTGGGSGIKFNRRTTAETREVLGSPLCYFVWKFYSNNFSPAYTAVLNT